MNRRHPRQSAWLAAIGFSLVCWAGVIAVVRVVL